MDEKQLLSARQVASYLQLSVLTIYDWAQKGNLPAIKVGRNWRFRRSDLEAWLDRNSHPPVIVSGEDDNQGT